MYSRSIVEAKFIALDLTGEEADWLRNMLTHIPQWNKPVHSIPIHCDTQAVIARLNPKYIMENPDAHV